MSSDRVIECLVCSSELCFPPGALSIHCPTCEDDRPLPLRFSPEVKESPLQMASITDLFDGRSYQRCSGPGCGVLVSSTSRIGSCPCCVAPLVKETGRPRILRPHGYLPFLKTLGEARARLRRELARLGLPKGTARLERAYLPWVLVSCAGRADYDGRRGTEYEEEGNTRVAWMSVSGRVERPFENIRASVSPVPQPDLCHRLKPWDWAFAEPASMDAPVDAPVVHTTMEPKRMFSTVFPDFENQIEQDVCFDIGGDRQEVDRLDAARSDERYRMVMVPVWIGALRHLHKIFVINGRTGVVAVFGHERSTASHVIRELWQQYSRVIGGVLGGLAVGAVGLWVLWSLMGR